MTAEPHFATLILKLTAFCNLNCTYCYMFNLADRTFSRVPSYMPVEVAILGITALAEHIRSAGSRHMKLVLHGGEPSLWPMESFRSLFGEVARLRASGLNVDVALQTNGLQMQHELIQLLIRQEVSLGFSLDGPRSQNDRFRVTHRGSGSYNTVIKTVANVLDWGYDARRIGILTVINPDIAPETYLRWSCQLPTRNISILWPIHLSWSNPPWNASDESTYASCPKYGRWMADTFKGWWDHYVESLYVRQFVETIARVMGSRNHSDSIGNDLVDMFIINTDGGIEYPDYLRAHRDEGSRTGFNIGDCRLENVRRDPTFQTLLRLRDHLPTECRPCPEQDVCGGGFLAGRSDSSGFHANRRSVLCQDQLFYFQKVRETIRPYLNAMGE